MPVCVCECVLASAIELPAPMLEQPPQASSALPPLHVYKYTSWASVNIAQQQPERAFPPAKPANTRARARALRPLGAVQKSERRLRKKTHTHTLNVLSKAVLCVCRHVWREVFEPNERLVWR